AEAGANWISVHVETCRHLDRTVHLARSHGLKAGVVLNPATPLSSLDEILGIVDHVLVMSVNPGFGGQKFIPAALEKIARLRKVIHEKALPVKIEVDGGVGRDNLCELIRSGAEILVIGSHIYGTGDPGKNVRSIIELSKQCFEGVA